MTDSERQPRDAEDPLRSVRIGKREGLEALGIDPYPYSFERTHEAVQLERRYPGSQRAPKPKIGCGSPAASGRCVTAACSSTCTTPRARSRSFATRICPVPNRSEWCGCWTSAI